jgi:chaperone required for assembly of F1-ATPase
MRDILDDVFRQEPLDPVEAARRSMRAPSRKRFYTSVGILKGDGGQYTISLDGKPVRTPARRQLSAPTAALAQALAAEWDAQRDVVVPGRMPLTRLANAIIDRVSAAPSPVADEVRKYLESDLVFYRASTPEGLVAQQAKHWDPVLVFAREALGARFVLGEGMVHVKQSEEAVAAAAAAIPDGVSDTKALWRLGAVHALTTLTGSALIALAVLHGAMSPEAAWAAAHVDEDWNMGQWGRDEMALEQRAFREAEMRAAAAVIDGLRR